MAEWQNQSIKFNSQGLDLIHPLDQIAEHAYCFFSNATSLYEGSLVTRPGLMQQAQVPTGEGVHSLWRVQGLRFIGAGARLYYGDTVLTQVDPAETDPETVKWAGWTGNGGPISHVEFKPEWSDQAYTYITDGSAMRKVDLNGKAWGMGIDPPNVIYNTVFAAPFNVDPRVLDPPLTIAAGGGLDSSTSGAPYDWRYTYYNSYLGIESNPCDVGDSKDAPVGSKATFQVWGSPDPQVDQIRIYRRGGTLYDWYLTMEVENTTADPAAYGRAGGIAFSVEDVNSDDTIAGNEILSEENDKPITTYDPTTPGTIYGEPLKILFGPLMGKWIFGIGDQYRPGHLYWMNAWNPDASSSVNNIEVTSPDEPLMTGFIHNGKAYVVSNKNVYAIYPNMSGDTQFVTMVTPAGNGAWSRYCIAIGPKVWFLGKTGIYEFIDGAAQNIIEDSLIRPIFRVWTGTPGGINTHPTVDWDESRKDQFRMEYQDPYLYFMYPAKDVETGDDIIQTMRYHTLVRRWEPWSVNLYSPAAVLTVPYWEQNTRSMLFGSSDGYIYNQVAEQWDNVDPNTPGSGTAINVNISTAFFDQDAPRSQKIYGDAFIEYNSNGVTNMRVTPYINEDPANGLAPVTLPATFTRQRTIIPLTTVGGDSGILARSIAFNINWTADVGYPEIHELNVSFLIRPDEQRLRETDWDDCGHAGPKWIRGVLLDVDLMGNDKTIYIQYVTDGLTELTPAGHGVLGPYTMTKWAHIGGEDQRQHHSLSWPVIRATRIRIIGADSNGWMLYKATWLAEPEPEQISKWDGMGWEDLGWPYEKYIKGVSVECDTRGQDKTLVLRIDGDDTTAVDFFTANTVGRSIVMMKFNNVLARTVKLVATDDNPGHLYGIKWIWDREPPRITRWETQENTFESGGYKYLREVLVGVRSWAIICLDIWVDMGDGSFNFQLPRKYIWSTNGERQKPKVEIEAVKGKNFKFLFTSEQPFKLYLEDSEVRVKEWVPDLGWKVYQLPFEGGIENP